MQAVFRLVEHDGARRINHLIGDFQAAVSGEAVEEHGARLGVGHQIGVDLVRRKNGGARLGFAFLPHAGPDIGIDGLRAGNGFFGRAEQVNLRANTRRGAARLFYDFGIFPRG